ncbi:hypothetical protein BC943DRAFT_326737 [Umbelopsis sp. AD052]|nr:hypothetical protein BC943DRAFT_326737 [Umbelopsis sp. AD052]
MHIHKISKLSNLHSILVICIIRFSSMIAFSTSVLYHKAYGLGEDDKFMTRMLAQACLRTQACTAMFVRVIDYFTPSIGIVNYYTIRLRY